MTPLELYAVPVFLLLLSYDADHAAREMEGLDTEGWETLAGFCRENVVLVRTQEALEHAGIRVGQPFAEAASWEAERVAQAVVCIGSISALCTGHDVEFVFPKAFQHYPDMGHDIDLLVTRGHERVDGLLRDSLGCVPDKGSLFNTIARKSGYVVPGCDTPLEVHHGRMGHAGEHNRLPAMLVERRRTVSVQGTTTYVPSTENQLTVQAVQRVCAHLTIRLGDALDTALILQANGLDWDHLVTSTIRLGVFRALGCYLSYVEQVHRALTGRPLVPVGVGSRLPLDGWGAVLPAGAHYRLPIGPVIRRVLAAKLFSDAASGNWEGAARTLVQMPVPALVAARDRIRRSPVPSRSRPPSQ